MSELEPTIEHLAASVLHAARTRSNSTSNTVPMSEKHAAYQKARRIVDVVASILMSDKLRVMSDQEIITFIALSNSNQTGLVNLRLLESYLEQKIRDTDMRDILRGDKNAHATRAKSEAAIKSLSLWNEQLPAQVQSPTYQGSLAPGAGIQR